MKTSICARGGEECSSWQMYSGRDGNVKWQRTSRNSHVNETVILHDDGAK